MDRLDVVEQRDVKVGLERLDLIEVEGGKQAVLPPECRMCIDHHVLVPFGGAKDLLEDGSTKGIETRDRQIQNAAGGNIGRLGIHHLPDMTDRQVYSVPQRF